MQGNAEVIAYLNELTAGELAARDQYFIHARMYDEWGYSKLFEANHHEMQHETEHATLMIKRVLMLGGTPNMVPEALHIGTDVKSMCEQHHDFVTRNMLIELLKVTEEDHAHWLEQQLRHIEHMGLANYLQSQL